MRWTGIILWHHYVAWNDPLAQLVTLLVTQTIEGERLVAVQSNRWIYWTKSIFLKMERVPSGSMGCNLPSPLRGPISPFSAVSRETFTPSVPDSMGLNLLSQFLYQMFYFLSLLSGWFVCYFRPDFCRHLRRQKEHLSGLQPGRYCVSILQSLFI